MSIIGISNFTHYKGNNTKYVVKKIRKKTKTKKLVPKFEFSLSTRKILKKKLHII